MYWFTFLRLIRTIFGSAQPDIVAIQDMGLLAVKIAQVFALRIDFLSQEKCRHLAQLYRHTVSLPEETLRKLLSEYTDPAFHEAFAFIEPQPLASASVGQVHRARLRSGSDVIVKVIKRDAKKEFARDVRSLRRLFLLVIFFYRKLEKVADPIGILESIEDYTLKELNLLNEIRGQEILQHIRDDQGGDYDLSRLRFAGLHRDLSNENVLVADYIPGKTFDELLEEGRLAYSDLLKLFHIHGFYMFCVGTFHGDIHPGNIILSDGNLYFVDTSAISTTGPKIRQGLFRFFKALAYWEYDQCAHWLNRMADGEITGEEYRRFEKKFIDLYGDFTDATVSTVSLTQRMMDTIKLGVNSGMVFEKGIFSIIKSLMYLDGMVLRCKPDAVLMKDMRQFIGETERIILGGG